ncbi:hypothetical protein Q1695_000161 [Nippostrongylus brasiliensis]|nr:hypothetical protein Q1695_000161 [Nippostrongylus brasiliensis]
MVHENDAAYRGVAWDDALKFCKDFAAGASAAVVAKTLIAPVERVKLILQLQNAQTSLPVEKRYNGLIDCFIRVPKEQGFLSFWRGNWVNILRSCSQESLGFAFKDFFKIWTLNGVDGIEHRYRFLIGNIMAGGGAGIATYMIIYPLDFVRTRLAIDLGKSRKNREFVGMFDCVRKIVKHDGIVGIYKGLLPSLQYIVVYRGAYYGLFDSAKPLVAKDGHTLGFWRAFAVGQVVTLIAAMLSYPLDTVRRRIMMGAGKKEFMYKGTIDCAKYIYINEGWKSFFSGAMINAMRGTGAALVLALYNEMTKFI